MIGTSSLLKYIKFLFKRDHSKTLGNGRNFFSPAQKPCTLSNTVLRPDEYSVQRALGTLEEWWFYDGRIDKTFGIGQGPYIVYARSIYEARFIFMQAHGYAHGVGIIYSPNWEEYFDPNTSRRT